MRCSDFETDLSACSAPPFDMSKQPEYFTPAEIKSKGCLFNIIGGPRGNGKSTGVLLELCKLNDERMTWAYVRRYAKEMTRTRMQRVLRKVGELNGHSYNYAEKQFFDENNKIVGEAFGLSDGELDKSINFDDIGAIVFDEYTVSPTSFRRYLPGEVTTFFDLYKTIARQRDVPVYMLGNNQRTSNPYLTFFGIKNPRPGEIVTAGDVAVQRCQSMAAAGFEMSRFDKMVAGTAYGDYSFGGEGMETFSHLVRKQAAHSVALFDILANGDIYGVFAEPKTESYFTRAKSAAAKRTLSADEPPPNGIPLFARSFELKRMQEQYKNYKLFFDNEETAETIISLLQ